MVVLPLSFFAFPLPPEGEATPVQDRRLAQAHEEAQIKNKKKGGTTAFFLFALAHQRLLSAPKRGAVKKKGSREPKGRTIFLIVGLPFRLCPLPRVGP